MTSSEYGFALSLTKSSISSSTLILKSVIRHLRPFLNTELILELSDRNPEKAEEHTQHEIQLTHEIKY